MLSSGYDVLLLSKLKTVVVCVRPTQYQSSHSSGTRWEGALRASALDEGLLEVDSFWERKTHPS